MVLAALIIIGDDAPVQRVVGLEWPEFQVRRAVAAGARHVVVAVERVERSLVLALDRLRADGVTVDLVRAPGEIGDRFHPDEAVLVLTGGLVVAAEVIDRVARAEASLLLCVAEPVPGVLERVDRHGHWLGVARLDGAQVRRTSALLGEWDLASTLLRGAVQDQAARITLDDAEAARMVSRPGDAASARSLSRRLATVALGVSSGWGERCVIAPLARGAAYLTVERSRSVTAVVPALTFALLVAALALAGKALPAWSAATVLLAAITVETGRRIAGVTGLRVRFQPRLPQAVAATAAMALPVAALAGTQADYGPLVLALAVVATLVLAGRLHRRSFEEPTWLADAPGVAVVVLLLAAIAPLGFQLAVGIGAVHGLITLVWLQNRLSAVLTTLR